MEYREIALKSFLNAKSIHHAAVIYLFSCAERPRDISWFGWKVRDEKDVAVPKSVGGDYITVNIICNKWMSSFYGFVKDRKFRE